MNKMQILIVDDEVEFASTLVERLALRGIEARSANRGEEAVALVKASAPDVVILDLKMPDLSGLEVLSRIKAIDSSIEVIMLTGHGSSAAGIDGMEQGAFDYLMKPVDLTALLGKIEQAYKKRTGERERQ
jgi:DNA-binding NtrC family response regulator